MTSREQRWAQIKALFIQQFGPFAWRWFLSSRKDLVAELEHIVDQYPDIPLFKRWEVLLNVLTIVTPPRESRTELDELFVEHGIANLWEILERFDPIPPPTAPMTGEVRAADPRDGDGWTDAVAAQGVRVPSYHDGYLQSTHWERVIDQFSTGTCVRCRRPGKTQLHHIRYDRLGMETAADLRELCDACHRREHPRSYPKAA